MGVDLATYRTRIGTFICRRIVSNDDERRRMARAKQRPPGKNNTKVSEALSATNLKCAISVGISSSSPHSLGIEKFHISPHIQHQSRKAERFALALEAMTSFVLIMQQLLLLSGNVERNPGPLGQYNEVPVTLDSEPSLPQLMDKVAAVIPQKFWAIGLQLGLTSAELQAICPQHHSLEGCHRAFSEIFDVWRRRGSSPYTWRTLIDVLRRPIVDEVLLSEQLASWIKPNSRGTGTCADGTDCTDGTEKVSSKQPTRDERRPMFETWDSLPNPKYVGKNDKEWKEVEEYSKEVKILIQSCNINEYRASLELLQPIDNVKTVIKFSAADEFPIVLGKIANRKCALVQTRQGIQCQKDISISLNCLPKVEVIIGIGIAFAISRDEFKYGDVLIGRSITDYENAKIEDDKITPRLEVRQVHGKLHNIFCLINPDEWKFHDSRAVAGSIASKAELINDSSYIAKLAKNNHIGGEMEACFLQRICNDHEKIHCIVIKGVSDFADGHKDDRWQITAAKAAANYFTFCLKNSDAFL